MYYENHEFVDRIDNSVRMVTVGIMRLCRVMPNCDPRDRIVYPIRKRMLDSFSSILLGASALINPFLARLYKVRVELL